MLGPRLKRKHTYGTCSFNAYQVYVCQLADSRSEGVLGLAVQPSDSIWEIPIALPEGSLRELRAFCDSVIRGDLPQKIRLGGGADSLYHFLRLVIKAKRTDNFGHTTYRGRGIVGTCLGAKFNSIAISERGFSDFARALEAGSSAAFTQLTS